MVKILLLLLGLSALPLQAEPKWVVGELSVHYPPFHMELGKPRRGIYADLTQALLHRVNISHRTRYFTFSRLKRAYNKGDVQISCCTNPAWWQDVGGVDNSLFSIPLLDIRDLWVFPRGYAFDPAGVLADKRIALIRAFGYRGLEDGQYIRMDFDDVDQQLDAVDRHEADAAIVNEWVLLWELQHKAYGLDQPQEQDRVSVHVVVRPEASHLLPLLNQTIEEMQDDGSFDAIIRSYLPDFRPTSLPSPML